MMVGCPQNPKHHPEGDVFTHTLSLLEKLEPGCSLTLALAALLHDIAKPTCIGFKDGEPTFYNHEIVGRVMAYTILTSLKYPNEVIETVAGHVGDHMRFRVTDEMRRGKLYRFLRQPNFEELLELHRLDALSGSGNLEHYNFVRKVLAEVPPEKLRPEKLLTGRDLIDMGLAPGPKFKAILDAIEEAQLDGKVSTREEALAVVKSAYGVKTESHEEVK
jgi:poly(A) polymerase